MSLILLHLVLFRIAFIEEQVIDLSPKGAKTVLIEPMSDWYFVPFYRWNEQHADQHFKTTVQLTAYSVDIIEAKYFWLQPNGDTPIGAPAPAIDF